MSKSRFAQVCDLYIAGMDATQWLGLGAGALTSTSLLPQVIKIWKTRSARDLSIKTYGLFWIGIVLWIAYGVIKKDIPVVATNCVSIILASTLIIFKLKFKDN